MIRRDILKATLGGFAATLAGRLPDLAAAPEIPLNNPDPPLIRIEVITTGRFRLDGYYPSHLYSRAGSINREQFGPYPAGHLLYRGSEITRDFELSGQCCQVVNYVFEAADRPWNAIPWDNGYPRPYPTADFTDMWLHATTLLSDPDSITTHFYW